MENQAPPLGDIAETRARLGLDTTDEFKRVVEDGIARRHDGQPPVLRYKDVTDPTKALWLAMMEWETRRFIQERHASSAQCHLMQDVKRLGTNHYQVYTTPWQDPLQPITELRELALRISRTDIGAVTLEASMNGVAVRVRWCSKPELITRDWLRANQNLIEGPIGPHVPTLLGLDEVRRDERYKQADRAYQEFRDAAYTAKLQTRQRELDAALSGLPEMKIGNAAQEALWQQATPREPQQFIIGFGKTWTRLMQAEMARGKSLEEVIEPTYWLAHGEIGALFGSEVGAVLNYVALTWIHRDSFKQHVHLISSHRVA
jgi:hypothetical protein